MMLALGTSTPTSITVVATSTLSRLAAKAAMVASLALSGMAPCSSPTALAPKIWERCACRSSAAASSDFSELSISGHTQ